MKFEPKERKKNFVANKEKLHIFVCLECKKRFKKSLRKGQFVTCPYCKGADLDIE